MSSQNKYFVIPFENVPASPAYTVWFSTWSKERPLVEPGMSPPLVVGVTAEAELPAGATLLGEGSKDPPPPPPPLGVAAFSQSEYQSSVSTWLELGRDEDE
jgi:hypothetical protein